MSKDYPEEFIFIIVTLTPWWVKIPYPPQITLTTN